MYQCLKITLKSGVPSKFMRNFALKNARALRLEGAVQVVEKLIEMIVCGHPDRMDEFIELLHKKSLEYKVSNLEIESFPREKDYRGVFRVIE